MVHRVLTTAVLVSAVSAAPASAAKKPSTAEAAHQVERYLKKALDIDTENGGFVAASCKKPTERRGVLSYDCKAAYGTEDQTDATRDPVEANYTPKKKVGKRWSFYMPGGLPY